MRDTVSIEAVSAAARAYNLPGPDHRNCGESVILALYEVPYAPQSGLVPASQSGKDHVWVFRPG